MEWPTGNLPPFEPDAPLAVDPIYNPPRPGLPAALMLSSFKRDYRPGRDEQERESEVGA